MEVRFEPGAVVFVRMGDQEGIDVEPALAVPREPTSQDVRHIRRIVIWSIGRSADVHVDKYLPPALKFDERHVAVADREKRDFRHHATAPLCWGEWAIPPPARRLIYSRRQDCRRLDP